MPLHVLASQQAPPRQLPTPLQPTPHEEPLHFTRPHDVMPAQVMVVKSASLATSAAHERAPTQSTMHVSPLHAMGCLHVSGVLQ